MTTQLTMPDEKSFAPLGDAAVLVEFADHLDLGINAQIQQLAFSIRARQIPWIRDIVPALASLAIHVSPNVLGSADAMTQVRQLVHACLSDPRYIVAEERPVVVVPVCYAEEFALDLPAICASTRLEWNDVIKRHLACDFRVLMVGFVPGHPYLGGLDPRLAVPRRSVPRLRMPAGSVAIANAQCVVYPYEIPGGWSVVGRTPLRIFDAARNPPSLFRPADRVRFESIDRTSFDALAAREGMA